MNAAQFARDLRSARRSKRFQRPEFARMRGGTRLLCESETERDLVVGFDRALSEGTIRPDEVSIRELFESLIDGGREIVDSWNPRHGGGGERLALLEASGAVNSSAFSAIAGQVLYTAFLQGLEDEGFVFTPLIPTQQTQFSGERIPGITKLADGADRAIGEAEPYPFIGPAADWIDTPQTTKRGVMSALTKEAVFFDRTGQLVQQASEVGREVGYWKEIRAINAFIDENDTTHRYKWQGTAYATYQTSSPWDNVTASNALVDWTDIDAAEQTLAAIVDPNTGRPIINMPKDLVVTRQLLQTARRIVSATEIRFGDGASATTQTISSNPVQNYRIISSQLLAAQMGTDTTWYLGDIARQLRWMQNWPMTVVQAPTNAEDEFKRDIVMQWKASERGVFATLEPRVTTKNTVA